MALALLLAAQLAAAAPQDCQAALGPLYNGVEESALPGQVDGASLQGADALIALRRAQGDALITIRGGNFANADLRGARLHNICFLDTDFSGSDWREAEAPGIGFVRANLAGARLAGARLDRILIRNANMDDVDATGAFLVGGRLDGGWFEGSITRFRLDRADLTNFRFNCGITLDDGCPVDQGDSQISLRGANLTHANFRSGFDLAGARIDGTEVEPTQLFGLDVAEIAGSIRVVGGGLAVVISPTEYRALRPHLVDSARPEPPAPEPTRGPPPWAAPGALALFVDEPLLFDDGFRATALYRRLLPVLIDASWSRVAVRVLADGRIEAAGEAIGANAHSCTLEAEGLSLDLETGWYSGSYQPTGDEPAEWRTRPMPVVHFWGDRAEVYMGGRSNYGSPEGDPRASDYASCGARAGFRRMVRVPGGEEEARRMLAGRATE